MRILSFLPVLVLMATACIPESTSRNCIQVMTYNIRFDNPGDGPNAWSQRKEEVAALIEYYQPDFLGTQEGLKHQLDYLDHALTGFAYVGVGRDDGKHKGEYSAIFYRKDKWKVSRENTFWLSETPNQVSVGWDASMERICTYALLSSIKKEDTRYWVFNVHFDHVGAKSRLESAKLVHERIQIVLDSVEAPVLITGDFNALPADPEIEFLSMHYQDSYAVAQRPPYGPEGTFTGFDFSTVPKRRIDYIFAGPGLEVEKYAVIDDFNQFRYPSDHLPVMSKICITSN